MATTTTYVLVSGVEEIDAVREHPVITESDLDHTLTREAEPSQHPSVQFEAEHALDEAIDFEEPARALSDAFPEATVVLCVVEERFDHVERLKTELFVNGKEGGKVEHGYIFNVGEGG